MDYKGNFERDGFLAIPGFFSAKEIDGINDAISRKLSERSMTIVVDDIYKGKRTLLGLLEENDLRDHRVKVNDLYLEMEEVRWLA